MEEIIDPTKERYFFQDIHWHARAELVAKYIKSNTTILDLGGGNQDILQYIAPKKYISVDKFPVTSETIECNFNEEPLPDFEYNFDYILCQGLIEYLIKPFDFLNDIHKYGDTLVITYYPKDIRIFKNYFEFHSFEQMLYKSGWRIQNITQMLGTPNQRIYFCKAL